MFSQIYLGLINSVDLLFQHNIIDANDDYYVTLRHMALDNYLSLVYPDWQFIDRRNIFISNDGQVCRTDCYDANWAFVIQGPIQNSIDPTPKMF